jgi:uroporphyrinogen decarboxylase
MRGENKSGRLPLWMMRQAGRYHSHYQKLREKHSFRDLCLKPALACETTLGPIRDFGFDAAILFSYILFALEAMGVAVSYPDKGPQLAFHVRDERDIQRIRRADPAYFSFQQEACGLLRHALPQETSLIGFCGAPWTLFVFLVEGTHRSDCAHAIELYRAGIFRKLAPLLEDACVASLEAQARGGADVLQVFDSAAGILDSDEYAGEAFESHYRLLERTANFCRNTIFFPRGATAAYTCLKKIPAQTVSFDWNFTLPQALTWVSKKHSVQGNFNPDDLLLEREDVVARVVEVFGPVAQSPRLIANLGHGILPKTPAENVRAWVEAVRSLSLDHVQPTL